MNKSEFKEFIDSLNEEEKEIPEWLLEKKGISPKILELKTPNASFSPPCWIDYKNIQLFNDHCRFEIIPEGSWIPEIETQYLFLPYSSIVVIEKTIRIDNNTKTKFPYYKLIISYTYGKLQELENRYIYERDGKNVHYIQENIETLLTRILRELSEMNKSNKDKYPK
ncbi:MAG: hypothetical protein KDK36_12725 [Leptospiraceae bacterium]|nr:hypothetical protein [Leptospiraceae bacterium]